MPGPNGTLTTGCYRAQVHVLHVVGGKANFLKASPVVQALAHRRVRQTIVHTGPACASCVADPALLDLGLPEPNVNLAVGSGTHAWQTAEVMNRLEPLILKDEPDIALVYGDVNSTVAAALACSKLGVRVGHVEAGLRLFDRSDPNEMNRVLSDHLADLLFTASPEDDENLLREGIAPHRIHRVGNVTIDALVRLLPQASQRRREGVAGLNGHPYGLIALNRASRFDDQDQLARLFEALSEIAKTVTLVVPVPPKALQRVRSQFPALHQQVQLVEPLSYIDLFAIETQALFVVTDCGDIQEQTTFLGVPCLTLRTTTERPVTWSMGSTTLVGEDLSRLKDEVRRVLRGEGKTGSVPPLWDGAAAQRLAEVIG